ncbi:MAG: hypothetical protein NTY61_00960 [Candidatus Parcubacteria bacterium]|nr:hypothetical protein [Candidatus Parcubacteria bacterium]
MNNNKDNVRQFTISNPDRTRKFVSAFSYDPDESNISVEKISFVLEIEYHLVPSPEDIIWAKNFNQNLISFIKENYYQSQLPLIDIYKKFEGLLQKLNKFLIGSDLTNKTINLVLAILDKENLYFAQIGSALAYLWQKNSLTPLTEAGSNPGKNKRFANIVSGILEDGDQVFFATNNFFDYLPQVDAEEQFRRQKELSIPKINSLLKKLSDKISLGLLTIKKPIPVPIAKIVEPSNNTWTLPKTTKKSTKAKTISPAPASDVIIPAPAEPVTPAEVPIEIVPEKISEDKTILTDDTPTIQEIPVVPSPTKKKKSSPKKEKIKPSVIGADQPLHKISPRLVIEDALLQELTVSTKPYHIEQPPPKKNNCYFNFY